MIEAFLKTTKIEAVNDLIIEKAIEYRREKCLKVPDALVVATAVCNDAILYTADKKILNILGERAKNPSG